MDTYRFCDNVWTFMLSEVEFKETQEITRVEKLKIVACDGKSKYFLFLPILRCFTSNYIFDTYYIKIILFLYYS